MNYKPGFFVTAIGTNVGKTIVSSILCQGLGLDYWKPVQAGNLEKSDSMIVSDLLSDSSLKVHFEKYRLETACSPHLAAGLDGVEINVSDFKLPNTENGLIVEGAGGLLVPLNQKETVLDLIEFLRLPVILVSKNYLGSINHTLLTISKLKERNISLKGIIFNGEANRESEKIIKSMSGVRMISKIDEIKELNKNAILDAACKLKEDFDEFFG